MAHEHNINCLQGSGRSLICNVTGKHLHLNEPSGSELPSKKGANHTVKVVPARFSSDAGKYDGIIVAHGIGIVAEMNGMPTPKAAFDAIMSEAKKSYPEEFDPSASRQAPRGLTEEQARALLWFAKKNGRTWKSKLSLAWRTGKDTDMVDGYLLRQVRNNLGPSWLTSVSMSKLQQAAR